MLQSSNLNKIYLDNASTSKPDEQALNKASKYYLSNFHNPSSLYKEGVNVSLFLDKIREKISSFFGFDYEVIFTSCGTESDNTVLDAYSKRGNIVISAGEHSAIYEKAKKLREKGGDIRIAKLNKNGCANEESLFSLVDENTKLVSVIHINNETGAVNDVDGLAKKCKEKNKDVVFHTDGVQSFLKADTHFKYVDLFSLSGHKIGAIKGVGALIKRKNLYLAPLIFGGGQEKGRRSGTENVFGLVDLYYAIENKGKIEENYKKVQTLKNVLLDGLSDKFYIISDENCSPYVVCFSAVGLKSEIILHLMEDEGILIGTGSACSKNSDSRVLKECGYSSEILQGVLRVSFSPDNTVEEVERAKNKLNECVEKLTKIMRK